MTATPAPAVTDRGGATDAEFRNRIAAFEGADAAPESWGQRVEAAARAIERSLDSADPNDWMPRALAAAVIAAMPASPAPSTRTMLDVADNLDYYASKTTGGTHASGLEDAAAQLRAALAGQQGGEHTTDEEGR